jgi:dTDP-glucose pyrophosphorylase
MEWRKTLVPRTATLTDAMRTLSESSAQICLVVDESDRLLGTVTDGDIRRALLRAESMNSTVDRIMNRCPLTVAEGTTGEVLRVLMSDAKLGHIPLLNAEGRVVGLATLAEQVDATKIRENWCVLLAGGKGQRLRPLTDEVPKPLLHVGGKPILESIVEHLVRHRFRRFYVAVNYKADMVVNHFGDGSPWNVQIRYLRESQPLGTAGPLGLIDERPDRPVVVMNGDLLTTVNLSQMLDYHEEQDAVATMAVRGYDIEVPFGVVRIDGVNIRGIDEKPIHSFLCNAGIYVLSPEVLDYLPHGQPLDMPDLFLKLVKAGKKTVVFPVREYWLDVGRVEDLDRARLDVATVGH